MRKLKLWVACAMAAAMLALTACGKEDKLVLVTTEAAASQSDATTTEDILADIREEAENTTEEEKKREPASEEDKKVTMEAIYDANKGDTLLAGGNNYIIIINSRIIRNQRNSYIWYSNGIKSNLRYSICICLFSDYYCWLCINSYRILSSCMFNSTLDMSIIDLWILGNRCKYYGCSNSSNFNCNFCSYLHTILNFLRKISKQTSCRSLIELGEILSFFYNK